MLIKILKKRLHEIFVCVCVCVCVIKNMKFNISKINQCARVLIELTRLRHDQPNAQCVASTSFLLRINTTTDCHSPIHPCLECHVDALGNGFQLLFASQAYWVAFVYRSPWLITHIDRPGRHLPAYAASAGHVSARCDTCTPVASRTIKTLTRQDASAASVKWNSVAPENFHVNAKRNGTSISDFSVCKRLILRDRKNIARERTPRSKFASDFQQFVRTYELSEYPGVASPNKNNSQPLSSNFFTSHLHEYVRTYVRYN